MTDKKRVAIESVTSSPVEVFVSWDSFKKESYQGDENWFECPSTLGHKWHDIYTDAGCMHCGMPDELRGNTK